MSRLSVYEHSDYKKFIHAWLEREPNSGRGLRKALADAVGCQTPFITHVLSGDYQFSVEQAEACARWLGLSESELEYFILLVQKRRAGTRELEAYFARQISRVREQQTVLKKRLKIRESLSPERQIEYYSSWHFAAIHMAILIPEMRTVESLQKYFRLSRKRVQYILEFLQEESLIGEKNAHYSILKPVLHLERQSPLLPQHHANWRLRALESIQDNSSESLHYSAVMSLSQDDFEWVREKLSQLLEDLVERIKHSKDEKLASLCFDWFHL